MIGKVRECWSTHYSFIFFGDVDIHLGVEPPTIGYFQRSLTVGLTHIGLVTLFESFSFAVIDRMRYPFWLNLCDIFVTTLSVKIELTVLPTSSDFFQHGNAAVKEFRRICLHQRTVEQN